MADGSSDWQTEKFDAVAHELGAKVERNVALAAFTTFRVGGPAALFARVSHVDELVELCGVVRRHDLAVLCIGQGSNLLIADAGFGGIAVVLEGQFERIERSGAQLTAGAAVKLPVLARQSAAAGLTGLEWAVGVPGSVGGAVAMNAGGHGSDVRASLRHARTVNLRGQGAIDSRSADGLDLRYRSSNLATDDIVLDATFQLQPGDRARSEAEIAEIVRWRRANQPGGANCGSVFTNPVGESAGRMIDQAGLRGHRVGTAAVSAKHANFVQAGPGALASDVWALIGEVRRRVFEAFGVDLQPEVRAVGLPPLDVLSGKWTDPPSTGSMASARHDTKECSR